MINIEYTDYSNKIEFESKGHASHDICIAVSAICSAFIQYAMQKQDEGKVEITRKIYKRGNSNIEFRILKSKEEVESGIEALLIACELYARNYPKEIYFSANFLGR